MRPLVAYLLFGLLVPAAGALAPQAGEPDAAAAAPRYVDVVDYAFVDRVTGEDITLIPVGTTVTWAFHDTNVDWHRAKSSRSVTQGGLNQAMFDSGLKPPYFDNAYSYSFYTAGVWTYFCTTHGSMTGTIVVQP